MKEQRRIQGWGGKGRQEWAQETGKRKGSSVTRVRMYGEALGYPTNLKAS